MRLRGAAGRHGARLGRSAPRSDAPNPHPPLPPSPAPPSTSDPALGQALSDLHLEPGAPRRPPSGSPFGAPPPARAPSRLTRAALARAASVASGSDSDAGVVVKKLEEPVVEAAAPADEAAGAAPPAPPAEPVETLPAVPRAPNETRLSTAPLQPSLLDQAVALVYDPGMEAHAPPGPHVERPARVAVLAALLRSNGMAARCRAVAPRAATDGELLRAHSADHVRAVDASCPPGAASYDRGDMFYSPGTASAARLAAGCVAQAALAVLSGEARRAFAIVRPPGHHAQCARAQGFCFFNNVALAAMAAREAGAARVLVVDFDVHHGDGIQALTLDRPDIMYVSLHRGGGFYPGTGHPVEAGTGAAAGRNLNVAWTRGGLGDAEYDAAFDLVVMPAARAFDPDLVLVAAGFDAAAGDPLGGMAVTPAGFASMTRRLLTLAGGRVTLALEGGYNVSATAACAAACVEVLLADRDGGPPPDAPRARPSRDAAPAIAAAAAAMAPHWPAALGPLGDAAGFKAAWGDYCAAAKPPRALRPRAPGAAAA